MKKLISVCDAIIAELAVVRSSRINVAKMMAPAKTRGLSTRLSSIWNISFSVIYSSDQVCVS